MGKDKKEILVLKINAILQRPEVTAKELVKILVEAGWLERYPPLNQPHYYKKDVLEYIVVDKRYGEYTIQKSYRWKKYMKRILENL